MNDQKTTEENNIEAENTMEMSLLVLGGMEKVGLMNTTETEEDRGEGKKVLGCVRRCGVLKK